MYRYNIDRINALPLGLRSSFGGCRSFLLRLTGTMFHMMDQARQRRSLATLDERMLKDIGLTRSDVAHELARPFWR